MEIAFQILCVLMVFLAILQKVKWKMLLFYTLENVALICMYLAFSRLTPALISLVAGFRTVVFGIYAYRDKKPNILWLLAFEITFIVVTVLTFTDYIDLLPLFDFIIICYGSWQDNQLVLRICYAIGYMLSIVYRAIIGAYIAMGLEIFSLIFTIVCIIYYCILKKEKPLMSYFTDHFHKNTVTQ